MKKVVKSFKFRILAAVVSILLFGICIETVVWMNNTARQTERTMVDSFDSALSVANQNFAAAMTRISRLSTLPGGQLGGVNSVTNYLRVMREESGADNIEKLQAARELEQLLIRLFQFEYYVTGVSVGDLRGHQETLGIIMTDAQLREQPWLKDFMDSDDEIAWIAPHDSLPGRPGSGKRVFSIVRKIVTGSEVRGIELVDISCDILRDFYDAGELLVFITEDAAGKRLIYAGDEAAYPLKAPGVEIIKDVPLTGWTVRGWILRTTIRERTMSVLGRMLTVTALIGVLLCAVIGLVVSYMTRELTVLTNAVREVSMERMELPVVIQTEDEVGELYQQILFVGWLGVLLPLVLFSCVTSKLVWYIYVVYPPLAILAGLGLQTLAEQCRTGPVGVALVLVALVVTGTCFYSGASINMALVTGIEPSSHDRILAAVAENVEGRHNLYSVDGTWEQADAMVLEWTGKLTPCWGGTEAWEKDDDGLLLQYRGLTVMVNDNIVTGGGGYILKDHND